MYYCPHYCGEAAVLSCREFLWGICTLFDFSNNRRALCLSRPRLTLRLIKGSQLLTSGGSSEGETQLCRSGLHGATEPTENTQRSVGCNSGPSLEVSRSCHFNQAHVLLIQTAAGRQMERGQSFFLHNMFTQWLKSIFLSSTLVLEGFSVNVEKKKTQFRNCGVSIKPETQLESCINVKDQNKMVSFCEVERKLFMIQNIFILKLLTSDIRTDQLDYIKTQREINFFNVHFKMGIFS